MQAKYDVKNPHSLKQLVAAGAKLRPFPTDVMAEAFKQSMSLYQELSARNENWRKVYADYSRFRADQNLWFRFAESTFDRFMQAQKL
jgi:TRAP-type mannitol/chloroaromatic compound transport system substrate-binding protein